MLDIRSKVVTIDNCSSLFATVRHCSHHSSLFALFGTIRSSLFATIRYSLFGFPDIREILLFTDFNSAEAW